MSTIFLLDTPCKTQLIDFNEININISLYNLLEQENERSLDYTNYK